MIQDSKIRQSDTFEKVVRSNGKLFRIRFVVIERDGKLRGKVISCEEIQTLRAFKIQDSRFKSGRLYLPVRTIRPTVKDEGLRIKDSIVFPFSTLDFFVSQMTRAPSVV